MVDRNIAREFDIDDEVVNQQIQEALGIDSSGDLLDVIDKTVRHFDPGNILTGKIVNHIGVQYFL